VWLVGCANLASYWKLSLWFRRWFEWWQTNWPRASKAAVEVRVVMPTPLTLTVVLLPKVS
jgi:hypothetical protein